MPRWMRENFLTFSSVIWLISFSAAGCFQKDLSEYHRAKDSTAKPEEKPVSTQPEQHSVTTSNGEPSHTLSQPAQTPAEPAGLVQSPDDSLLPVSALVPLNVIDGGSLRSLMSIANDSVAPVGSPNDEVKTANGANSDRPAAEPRKIEILVKDKTFRTEPKSKALVVSFDDLDLLKVLNMDPVVDTAVEQMPAWLQQLDGKLIRIRGFMYPTYDTEGIEHFVLARDNQICCFGRDPKIYDLVQVDMKPGKTTSYIPATKSFDVVGKFKIAMQAEDGKPYGLYVIEQADVISK